MNPYTVYRIPYSVIILTACSVLLIACPVLCSESYGIISAEKPFLEGNYDKAVKESDRLIGAGADHKDELYYLKGLSQLKLNRFAEARKSFEELLYKYLNSSRVFDAKVGIGDSFFLEGNSGAAASIYNDVIQKYPGNTNVEAMRRRLADCDQVQRPRPAQEGRTQPVYIEKREPPARPQTISATERFSVQVGSFKSKKNADGLSRKLSGQGYPSYVVSPDAGGDKMYRVKTGKLLLMEEAEKLAAKLKVRGYPTRICPEN